jgi:hypothetical protein
MKRAVIEAHLLDTYRVYFMASELDRSGFSSRATEQVVEARFLIAALEAQLESLPAASGPPLD